MTALCFECYIFYPFLITFFCTDLYILARIVKYYQFSIVIGQTFDYICKIHLPINIGYNCIAFSRICPIAIAEITTSIQLAI